MTTQIFQPKRKKKSDLKLERLISDCTTKKRLKQINKPDQGELKSIIIIKIII